MKSSFNLKEHNEFLILKAELQKEDAPRNLLDFLADPLCKHCLKPLFDAPGILISAYQFYKFETQGKGEIKVEWRLKTFFPWLIDDYIRIILENCHNKCRYLKNRADQTEYLEKAELKQLSEIQALERLKLAEQPNFVPHFKLEDSRAIDLRRKAGKARQKLKAAFWAKELSVIYHGDPEEKMTKGEFLKRIK